MYFFIIFQTIYAFIHPYSHWKSMLNRAARGLGFNGQARRKRIYKRRFDQRIADSPVFFKRLRFVYLFINFQTIYAFIHPYSHWKSMLHRAARGVGFNGQARRKCIYKRRFDQRIADSPVFFNTSTFCVSFYKFSDHLRFHTSLFSWKIGAKSRGAGTRFQRSSTSKMHL